VFPSKLYAILDVDAAAARGVAPLVVLDAWLRAGVRLIQLRAKAMRAGPMLALADAMAAPCRAAGAVFIVNDRADVAAMAGADGVHLGQDDLSPGGARAVVGDAAWVGLSTHVEAQVEAACAEPITYLAFGPVFATQSKAQPDPVVGLDGVRRTSSRAAGAGLPVVAIGGITLALAPAVLGAGASAVAVISDLLIEPIGERADAYLRALDG
jgi:thiamine-phosphate pyrophosphorylase